MPAQATEDIFACCSRTTLDSVQLTCEAANRMVNRWFDDDPLHVVTLLRVAERNITVFPREHTYVDWPMRADAETLIAVDELTPARFRRCVVEELRFQRSHISLQLVNGLKTIAALWANGRCTIAGMDLDALARNYPLPGALFKALKCK
ncbi:hypothetical protein AAVH_34223, partial [Aphelenchoides avenae]